MAVAITITPRLLFIEDLSLTTSPSIQQTTVNVDGATSNPTTVTLIDMVRYSAFTSAPNDVAAAGAGVNVGDVYFNSTNNLLHTRMS